MKALRTRKTKTKTLTIDAFKISDAKLDAVRGGTGFRRGPEGLRRGPN